MSISFWPEDIDGAVSLSFDDGAPTQLENAIPLLDDHGFQGTFYVVPDRRPTWPDLLPRWQEACRNGHEMGNHTSQHPCSCNFGFRDDGYCLENLTLADIEQTIDEATEALDRDFPAQKGNRSFAYPCYQSDVGVGINRQSYIPLVARRLRCGRGWGERANNPRAIDLAYVWAWAVQGNTGEEMVDFVEDAMGQGFWAIICMHGVGGDHIAIETDALRRLVEHLDANRERIWTHTVIGVADHIIQRRAEFAET
ncbi:MAG: polysaccharide deacetylase family protein [Candidatus Latescibacteria bacterium]|jgi:peptidoglycan/xylan/chitin deacetylase (PgdA/CDA1 family)|nr:polysaccharide deacetylase family protein [Candidatus Latescibacterota bacterium]